MVMVRGKLSALQRMSFWSIIEDFMVIPLGHNASAMEAGRHQRVFQDSLQMSWTIE